MSDYHPLWQLTLTRVRSFFREPSAVFWTFGFPLILALALGVAFRNKPPDPVDVGVLPGDEAIFAALQQNPEMRAHRMTRDQGEQALRTGKVMILVEPGAPRTYRYDPTRPESRLARALVDDVLQRADGRKDPTAVADARVTAIGSRYIDWLIPGILGMNLMQGGLWGIGFVLVDLRNRKLIKRMVATPMRRSHFLLAFVLMRALFFFLELPILLVFARYVFEVPIGSVPLVVAMSVLGGFSFAGLGLLLAARANNTQTVSGLINLVSLPMFFLSGVFFSSARFPEAMQPLIHALPLTALNDALRAVMLDGAGLTQMLRPSLVIVAWGVASFALAFRLFRWR